MNFIRTLCFLLCFSGIILLGSSGVQSQSSPPNPEPSVTVALAGDAIQTRRIMPLYTAGDQDFISLVDLIRKADAAIVNLEESLFEMSGFKGWPEVENGGQWELGPPFVAEELRQMGFNLFSRANNHATDYGVEGMRVTDQLLDRLGIVHAGTGMTLGQASRPGYLDAAKARVALVSFASSFTEMSRAGAARDDVPGRPGLNALRLRRKFEVDEETFDLLSRLTSKIGGQVSEDKKALRLFQVLSPQSSILIAPGEKYFVRETPESADVERILREIRNAAKMSDLVFIAGHSHQPANQSQIPPSWQQAFARQCLDAGATAFLTHGPHQLRGIEIYKGKPIFYSLGNFIFQNETIDPLPADDYEKYDLPSTALAGDFFDKRPGATAEDARKDEVFYESFIAVPTFAKGQMTSLKLYPLELDLSAPRSRRGTPRIARQAQAERIIKRLAELSAPFGTIIQFQNGIGIWTAK
jgi:poly-gamma-glutamate capsule biosynthesis protein CapA/YwtB (metallophosphatase superfamily)